MRNLFIFVLCLIFGYFASNSVRSSYRASILNAQTQGLKEGHAIASMTWSQRVKTLQAEKRELEARVDEMFERGRDVCKASHTPMPPRPGEELFVADVLIYGHPKQGYELDYRSVRSGEKVVLNLTNTGVKMLVKEVMEDQILVEFINQLNKKDLPPTGVEILLDKKELMKLLEKNQYFNHYNPDKKNN